MNARLGNRISSLPVAQFCGLSPTLEGGVGRHAAMSSAFHALCAEAPDKETKLARLTDAEVAEIRTWHWPSPLELYLHGERHVLEYKTARTEFTIGLDADARYTPVTVDAAGAYRADRPCAPGTLDIGWELELSTGRRIAVVGDIKRTAFTSEVTSLQLYGYGFAFADLIEADEMVLAIWAATEGRWLVGEPIDLASRAAEDLFRLTWAAATNTERRPSPGAHCKQCFGRSLCPEWTLPVSHLETALAPFVAGQEMTRENLGEAVLTLQRLEDLVEKVKPLAKDAADRLGGARDPKTGKVWRAVEMKGRPGVNMARLREALGDEVDQFVTTGAPFKTYRWLKG